MRFQTISAARLDSYVGREDCMIVDLRPTYNYSQRHITGAVSLPFDELMGSLSKLSKEKTLVFYCQQGSKSLLACRELSALGFQTISVTGGLNYYRGHQLVSQ